MVTQKHTHIPAVSQTAVCIQDGDLITLESNSIKNNKKLTFTANILSLGSLVFRHGKDAFGASSIIIDDTLVQCCNYTTQQTLIWSAAHGLTIRAETHLEAAVCTDGTLAFSLTSNGKTFTKSNIPWIGTIGNIEMESFRTNLRDLTLSWDCANYSDSLWLFGDSYFSYYEARWPYYILQNSSNFLLSGFPGAPSSAMYRDFQTALTHGTPKMAVWCLGMNDPDSDSGINPEWLSYAERFVADCEKRGILPILATVPNVPDRIHCCKNAYVRASGLRYIDFASAVGANEKGSSWYTGMLSSDQVHPAVAGAQALANQVLLDLPEIRG